MAEQSAVKYYNVVLQTGATFFVCGEGAFEDLCEVVKVGDALLVAVEETYVMFTKLDEGASQKLLEIISSGRLLFNAKNVSNVIQVTKENPNYRALSEARTRGRAVLVTIPLRGRPRPDSEIVLPKFDLLSEGGF